MFEIVFLDAGPAAALHAVRLVGASDPLLTQMLLRERRTATCGDADRALCLRHNRVCGLQTCRRRERLDALLDRLTGACHDYGFTPGLFRDLSKYPYPVAALDASPFRLLGLRFSDRLFIALDGGFKRSQELKNDPGLAPTFALARHLSGRLYRAMQSGLIASTREGRSLTPILPTSSALSI